MDEIDKKLEELGNKIKNQKKNIDENHFGKVYKTTLERRIEAKEQERGRVSQALKVGSEFFSAILVGAIIGLILDKYITVAPLGLAIFLFIGTCAGFINVMRYANSKK